MDGGKVDGWGILALIEDLEESITWQIV